MESPSAAHAGPVRGLPGEEPLAPHLYVRQPLPPSSRSGPRSREHTWKHSDPEPRGLGHHPLYDSQSAVHHTHGSSVSMFHIHRLTPADHGDTWWHRQ